MSLSDNDRNGHANGFSQRPIPLRDLSEAVEEAELILLAEKINEAVHQMEEGQAVSQEVLQLEFSV